MNKQTHIDINTKTEVFTTLSIKLPDRIKYWNVYQHTCNKRAILDDWTQQLL